MADLTLTLKYDNEPPVCTRGARTVLEAANKMLRLLAAVERETTGKPPQIVWDVNVYSLTDRAVIEFNEVGTKKEGRRVVELVRLWPGWEGES